MMFSDHLIARLVPLLERYLRPSPLAVGFEKWPQIDMQPLETHLSPRAPRGSASASGIRFKLLKHAIFHWRGGRYRAPSGMLTDFTSVPPLGRPLVGQVGRHASAAVCHDAAYQGCLQRDDSTINELPGTTWVPARLSRAQADRMFLDLMAVSGSVWWRRDLAFLAVRLCGWLAFKAVH